MVYDSTRKAFLDDSEIEQIAKAQIGGADLPVNKSDWQIAIEERAETIYSALPLTAAQKFARAIGGMATVDRGSVRNPGDPLCRLYYSAMKIAPPAPAGAPEAPADIAKAEASKRGPASAQMLALAKAHKAANPHLTEAQSYDRVFTSPAHTGIKEQMAAEHMRAVNAAGI